MAISLRNLHVDELIVHDIPQRLIRQLRNDPDTQEARPAFSQIPSPVNEDLEGFFRNKITDTIGSSTAFDIMFDPSSTSPVPELVRQYFTENAHNRIDITQRIGQHLYDVQNALNSSGLLVFIRCSIREVIYLAILKLEREEGVRVNPQIERDGLRTFDIEHIRNLMLTEKTRLFKIALFYIEDTGVKGMICDQQRGYGNKDVADFFIHKFLGCKFMDEPHILTRKYFEATQSFINEKISSPEQKGELMNHLVSELTNQVGVINPSEFARRVLPTALRQDYIQYIQNYGVVAGSFVKDNCIIENRLRRIQYDFTSGITVYGYKEALDLKTRVSDLENGEMKMEITDSLKQVKTK